MNEFIQVNDVMYEVVEGDGRNILCEAVDKHYGSTLVVGRHGFGAIKRYMSLGVNAPSIIA